MPDSPDRNKRLLRVVFIILGLSTLFALAHTQAPLFTSNQNQYFLQGLAQAGFGNLSEDWLANTFDPTPVFSGLVEVSARVFSWPPVFYIYYAILMGIFLFSIVGIAAMVFPIRKSNTRLLLYFSFLFLVNSAGLRFALSRTLGDNWTHLLDDGLADQRLLGLVFQPSAFGILLLLSIYLFLKNRPLWAVLCAVLVACVHPTYLLSAGALTASYMVVVFKEARQQKAEGERPRFSKWKWQVWLEKYFPAWLIQPLTIGMLALVLVAPILVYVYVNLVDTPPETTAQARDILVNFRIPHHALISWWFDATAVIKIIFICGALALVRKTRLFVVMVIPALVALALTLIQVFTGSNVLALIFPWRLSTWLVPLSVALLLAGLTGLLFDRFSVFLNQHKRWVHGFSLALIALTVLVGGIRMWLDFDRKTEDTAYPAMEYVADHNKPGQVYLTPIKMQDFRLVSGAPVYVDFKSIPYRDNDVLEWYRRLQSADRFFKGGGCNLLFGLGQEGVTHVILPVDSPGALPG